MAKRKRLEVPAETIPADLETKSAFPAPRARMPIAEVAGEVAGRAALEEVAREMTAAEEEGRVVKKLPLDRIVLRHLARDRMVLDEEEMTALMASIEARGQQTPIEVLSLGNGSYGLISGLRRMEALKRLGQGEVLAILRKPETSRAAYQAMVEENEIRSDLSFYERAQIAVAAVVQGVYPDTKKAVKGLFAHAPAAKRSKITKFVTICEELGRALRFPAAIPEHLGIKLAQAIEGKPDYASGIAVRLLQANVQDAASERAVLEALLKGPEAPKPERVDIAPGLRLETKEGRAVLSGQAVDAAFLEALRDWAQARADG